MSPGCVHCLSSMLCARVSTYMSAVRVCGTLGFSDLLILVHVLQVHCAASLLLLHPCAAPALPNIQGDFMLSALYATFFPCAVFL